MTGIVDEALAALSLFHVEHAAATVVVLNMWRRADQLSADDWADILAHFPGRVEVGVTRRSGVRVAAGPELCPAEVADLGERRQRRRGRGNPKTL